VADRVDVAIIGGGIVGLATAHLLLEARPDISVTVLEKEPELAAHQSGHNSGVIHAGLYYAPGSLKATLCREGKAKLERFAGEHGIPFRHPGKLVIALSDSERPRLEALCERATANGVEGLEILGPERMRELEPHAAGVQALWSPKTGIIDFRTVALAYAVSGANPLVGSDLILAVAAALAIPALLFLPSIPFGSGAFGIGDVKLLVGIGLLVGGSRALGSVVFALAVSGVVLILLLAARRIGRRTYVPFGPFFIIGALWVVLLRG